MTDTIRREGRVQGVFGVVAAVAAWGFGPIFIKLISLEELTLVLYRVWLGCGVMVVVLLATGRRISWRDIRIAGAAGLCFGVNVTFFITSLKHTSVADASLITALAPVLILVAAGPLFGERVTSRDLSLTAVIIAGVVLVVIGSSGKPQWSGLGDLLAVGALVSWAAYFIATKQARATLGTIEFQMIAMMGAIAVVTPFALLSGAPLQAPRGDDWLWLPAFVLLPGAVGHLLMSWSHRYVPVSVSSLIVVGQPVVSALSAAVFLHESLGPLQLFGGAVVLAAIGVLVRTHRPLEAEIVDAE
jgi:drug/metabolite transporter (DMT)-like permease